MDRQESNLHIRRTIATEICAPFRFGLLPTPALPLSYYPLLHRIVPHSSRCYGLLPISRRRPSRILPVSLFQTSSTVHFLSARTVQEWVFYNSVNHSAVDCFYSVAHWIFQPLTSYHDFKNYLYQIKAKERHHCRPLSWEILYNRLPCFLVNK